MAQVPTDAPVGKTAQDHSDYHNELARIHNQLDDANGTNGDVLKLVAGAWTPDTPANHGLSTTGHTHVVSDITDLDLGAAQVVSGTYNAAVGDTVLICNTTGGSCTVNLPAVSGFGNQALLVIQYGASNVTINRNGTDEIWTDGSTATSVILSTTGSRWSGVAATSLSQWVSIS